MRTHKTLIIAFGLLALSMMVLGSFQVVETASSSFMGSRGTDSIVGYDAYNGYTASSSAALLSTPKSGYGNLYYSSDQYDQYKVAVVAGDQVTFHFVRSATTSYIDLYFYNNAKTRVLLKDNVKDFTYTVTATGSGYAYLAIDADSSVDSGNYYLEVTKNGGGGGGVEDGGALSNGVSATGHMDSSDVSDMWYIDVGANAESMEVILTCGSADFDTYGRFGAEPTTSTYDWRGYTSGGEENTISDPAQGRHYIMVRYYSGDSDYSLTATITYGTVSDTTPPTVSITNPSNGATVSGTVTISFSASDANGISSRTIKIDGVTKSTSSSYSWDTTAYSNAVHTIVCTAVDPSGNTGSDTHTVTVSNTVADTTPPTVTISNPSNGATVSGTISISFSASDANGISSRVIKIDGVTKSTSSSYSWDTTAYSNAAHTIRCEATDPSGNTGYKQISVTVSNTVVDDGGALSNGVAASGNMDSADGADMWWISVGANAQSMRVVLECGSADFDTYGRFGAQPTTSTYDWRGYTSGGEDNTVSNPAQGTHYIMVDYYSGSGSYTLTATITYAVADTTAPTVSISSPSNGATVSGTVTISFSASDANGISSRTIKIDGVTKSTSSSYSWDTTAYSNAAHTIRCEATDPSGNTGYKQISVTVSNTVVDDGGALTDGVAANGNMDSADGADMFWIDVGPNALSMYVVLTCGSSDFDTYGRFNAQPTTSTYDWRGYTSGGEENTVSSPQEGRHYIMVDYYSGSGTYTLTATITYGGGGGGSWGDGGKYAIIVGISDYQSINDLSYCDEDATDWYNFLAGQGYECHVYGDGHTSNYPRYDGTATEATVRAAVQELANHAQSGDQVAFVTSGHGAGDGNGNSYLCMYDCSGSSGCYYDYELASDIGGFSSGVKIFVFIDHCYSGGMGPELMNLSIKQYIYCTTTCTEDGYGYDDPTHNNGAWTYEYLERYWVSNPTASAEYIYDQASATYPHSGGDACMEFDGNTGSSFYI